MSQIIKNLASGPVPPAVATSYVTDVNSPAIPAVNILNVPGGATTANDVDGIRTDGSSGSNTLTIQLTNRFRQATTTSGAANSTVTILSALSAGEYIFDIKVSMRPTSGAILTGGGYTIVGAVDSDGVTATLVPGQQRDDFEPAHLVGTNVVVGVAVNTITVTFTGTAAYDLNWVVSGEYMLGT